MSNCNCHPEMISDGSGRLSRYLSALDPSYAAIDDRSTEELMVFIQRYAARIRFYDVPESKIEDGIPPEKVTWEDFFRRDVAVVAASIGLTDTAAIKKSFEDSRTALESAPDADKLTSLFTASLSIAGKINDWYALAVPENPLQQDLIVAIQSTLAMQLQTIMAYEEGYKLINPQKPLNLIYGNLDDNELWGTDKPVAADATIYEGESPEEKILNAALYAEEIFNGFYASLDAVANKAEAYMQFALEQYPAHQPHMALFIAFLKLFRLAQQQMNGLTGKLLDYYYRDVLQLTAKAALPDKVHVVFELAKNVSEYDLARDTLLKAGKDDSGTEQVYATTDDLVINRAGIKEIKTVYIEKAAGEDGAAIIQTIYANPVANSADGLGEPFPQEGDVKWNTFGGGTETDPGLSGICRAINQMKKVEDVLNYAMPGFAIASPQLVLGGGNRMILCQSDGIEQLIKQLQETGPANPLTIWLTAEKDWLKISRRVEEEVMKKILDGDVFNPSSGIEEPVYGFLNNQLAVFLPVSAEAIVAFDADLHQGYRYTTSSPVIQVMLNPGFNIPEDLFSSLTFTSISIKVKVGSVSSGKMEPQMDGLQSLILQNDEQALAPGKAFNPFTYLPSRGKSFYIGSEEVFNKPLTQLSVNIRTTLDDITPTVNVFVLRNRQWISLSPDGDKSAFNYRDLARGVLATYLKDNGTATLDRKPILHLTAWDPSVLKGFIRLDNQTSAQESELSLSRIPQELASRFEMKEISLSYTAELDALEAGTDQFFHVYPFGVAEIGIQDKRPNELTIELSPASAAKGGVWTGNQSDPIRRGSAPAREFHPGPGVAEDPKTVNAGNKLLPQFTFTGLYDISSGQDAQASNRLASRNKVKTPKLLDALSRRSSKNSINQYTGNVQEEGLLYIGLGDAKPLQSVSMLFQFAEGSAADEDDDPPPIHWSYLSDNQWFPLPGENLVSDGTYGFQTTGIIKISLPDDISDDNTIITSGLYWLRASVTDNANRIPMLISIVTQAVLAAFNDDHNSPDHYEEALAAGSISKLKIPVSEVSKVAQPFASFDGKPRETGKAFYTRVSERLRHKHRAVTAWDYEHLVLERFPSVYKIKCITHTDPNCLCRKQENADGTETACCGPQVAPGHVLLVPVADLKNRNGVDPLQPKTARRVLIDMVNYVKALTSPFVKVYAKNPVYEPILVFFRVQFISGTDIGFYLKKLNDEIVRYLTPWAFDEEADVVFGQKVYASSIINFIEERSYVDFITDFEMGVCKKDCCPPSDTGGGGADEPPADIISGFANCGDVEKFLSEHVENAGEIVATPSTARSILVSAPRHIIIPYEAPPVLSPCEQRQLQRAAPAEVKAADENNPAVKKAIIADKNSPAPAKPVETKAIKAPVRKIGVKNKVDKSLPVRKKAASTAKSTSAKTSEIKNKKSGKSG